jgi:hypothetical protein
VSARFPRGPAAFAGAAAALALLEASRALWGAEFSAAALGGRVLFLVAVLLAAAVLRPGRRPDGRWRVPGAAALALLPAGGLAALLAAAVGSDAAAWTGLAVFEAATLAAALMPAFPHSRAVRAITVLLFAGASGGVPMALLELESRFAHEEIFVALEAFLLAGVWLALWLSARRLFPARGEIAAGLDLRPGPLGAASLALVGLLLAVSVAAWQRSFSPVEAPEFPGISAEAPFLCGQGRPDRETYDGRRVFEELLSRVEANPRQGPPGAGMLALATGSEHFAGEFRSRLLEEARRRDFSDRGETKYWQYEASLRAYYYPRVRQAFPGLFPAEEERELASWFHEINRRALSRSLDDAIYALAFAKRLEGPYENQEIGAGLIALLQAGGLAAPGLSARNREYLERVPRGWNGRFRNSDDSYGYQSEWINNAWFQRLGRAPAPRETTRRSFEWLLLQAEPDGLAPDYNPAVAPQLPGTAYLGARLLSDARLLWLAGRSLEAFARRGIPLPAQPGAERPAEFDGTSPTSGSCLLYAEAGTPNRVGPLAPDKIVLRDGWTRDSAYLLWNLRFAGWHRYRATNAIAAVRWAEPVVVEKRGRPFGWLPLERRLFRDKRIPREFTNALLVPPDGLAAAIAGLAGFGGPWAQDPPSFAQVEEFRTAAAADTAVATISGWRGWRQRRAIALHRDGPIVVVDRASGPSGRRAAIAWHLRGEARGESPRRFRLGRELRAELVLVPLGEPAGGVESAAGLEPLELDVLYRPRAAGRLDLASVFLPETWTGASVAVRRSPSGETLEIGRGETRLSMPLP